MMSEMSQPAVKHKYSSVQVTELEKKLDNHDNHLPAKKLYIAMASLLFVVCTGSIDNAATSIAVQYMAKDLDSSKTIQWVGTSYGISLTVFTVLLGRFADLFGRKYILLGSIFLFSAFVLACGFAQTGTQLYIFRALVGVGSAGVSSLGILIVTDLVPFEKRPTFQGLLGIGMGLGDSSGPLLMSAFILHTKKSWRSFYYFMFPLILISAIGIFFALPATSSKLSKREIYKYADYPGFILATLFLVFLLLPLNGGGIIWEWSDKKTIIFFILSGVSLIAFITVEAKWSKIPTVPLRIFQFPGVANILIQSILYGLVFQALVYYLPLYFTIIREFGVVKTASMSVCSLLPLALNSLNAGRFISRIQNYNKILITGNLAWFIGACLMQIFNVDTPIYGNILILIIMGFGIGFTFQPSVIAIQAQALRNDRSVVVTTRNVFRSLGNAIGVAISSLIYSNKLKSELKSAEFLTSSQKAALLENLNSKVNLRTIISDEYTIHQTKKLFMSSIRLVFAIWIPLMAICLMMSLFIKDRGLQSIDETPKNEINRKEEVEELHISLGAVGAGKEKV